MNKRYWGAVLLIFTFLVMSGSARAACNHPYPGTGDWIINSTNSPLECNDTAVILKGNLTIQAGGEAVFDNVSLSMDPFMRIENQGDLSINSSNFTRSGVNPYVIVSGTGSYLTLENSDFSGFSSFGFSGTAANLLGNRIKGMKNPVFTVSNALIEGNNFTGSCLETNGTGNVILNNRMGNITSLDGCVFRGDRQTIEGNVFTGVTMGVFYYGDRSMISGNTYANSVMGFTVHGSHNLFGQEKAVGEASISNGIHASGINNTFDQINLSGFATALFMNDSSDSGIKNSVFSGNDVDIMLASSINVLLQGNTYVSKFTAWKFQITVLDENGTGIGGASVKMSSGNQSAVDTLTNENGTTSPYLLTGHIEDKSNPNVTGYLVYEILVEKEGYAPSSLSRNLTEDTVLNVTLVSYGDLNPFELVIESPENRTYLSDDPAITGSALRAVITSNLNMSGCNHTIREEKTVMTRLNNNTFESWFDVTGYTGTYRIDFSCRSDDGRTASKSLMFSMFESYACLSDDDCPDTEKCVRNQCNPVNCPCGEISNHTCTEYECCQNDDCPEEDEECDLSGHECTDVVCTCGYIEDHECKREPGYCCTDAHCRENEVCDTENNRCVKRTIDIEVEGGLWVGHTVKVFARDQDGQAVQGVGITVVYLDSGNSEVFFTNNVSEKGYCAEIPVKEQGEVRFTARKSGYETGTMTGAASVDIFSLILPVVIIIVLVPLLFFLYRTFYKPPVLKLEKKISGQNVSIRIKNRSGRNLSDIEVFDTLPRNSLRGAAMIPRLEKKDSTTDYLVWHILRLKPGEEVEISYTADRPVKGFTVKTGGKEYKG